MSSNIKIQKRDFLILQQITKYRFLLSRQIKILAGFAGQRSCDRRLKKLIDNGFIQRKYFIYGISGLYFATGKAKKIFNLDYITKDVRIDQIQHEIFVVDTAIFFMFCRNISDNQIITERQMKNKDGFSNNKHRPDLIIANTNVGIEVELNEKKFSTFENNVKNNYSQYDGQIWIVPEEKNKIFENLQEMQKYYSNIELLKLEEVISFVKELYQKK